MEQSAFDSSMYLSGISEWSFQKAIHLVCVFVNTVYIQASWNICISLYTFK